MLETQARIRVFVLARTGIPISGEVCIVIFAPPIRANRMNCCSAPPRPISVEDIVSRTIVAEARAPTFAIPTDATEAAGKGVAGIGPSRGQ